MPMYISITEAYNKSLDILKCIEKKNLHNTFLLDVSDITIWKYQIFLNRTSSTIQICIWDSGVTQLFQQTLAHPLWQEVGGAWGLSPEACQGNSSPRWLEQ